MIRIYSIKYVLLNYCSSWLSVDGKFTLRILVEWTQYEELSESLLEKWKIRMRSNQFIKANTIFNLGMFCGNLQPNQKWIDEWGRKIKRLLLNLWTSMEMLSAFYCEWTPREVETNNCFIVKLNSNARNPNTERGNSTTNVTQYSNQSMINAFSEAYFARVRLRTYCIQCARRRGSSIRRISVRSKT